MSSARPWLAFATRCHPIARHRNVYCSITSHLVRSHSSHLSNTTKTLLRSGVETWRRSFSAAASHQLSAGTAARPPTSNFYASVISKEADNENGSAAGVALVLQEMEREGVEIDSIVCHAALKALAVHPDPILRGQVLQTMQHRWHDLSNVGWHDLVAGLIKNEQLEEALDRLDAMRQAQIPVMAWLVDMLMYALCDRGEVKEALDIMQDRVRSGDSKIARAAWYYLLDTGCSMVHYETVHFVWVRQVELNHINPSAGQCIGALRAAARTGDIALATDVFRILSGRGTSLESHHYELLMDAYYVADDIKTPLTILCIMNSANVQASRGGMSTLRHTIVAGGLAGEAFQVLQELRRSMPEREIPTSALNIIIEATFESNEVSSPADRLDLAVKRYKQLHKICPSGPTLETFHALFLGCAKAPEGKATAMFFASEMVALKIEPTANTYSLLISVCLNDGAEYEDAFRYYEESRSKGWVPKKDKFERLIERSVSEGDGRAATLIEAMKEAGLDTSMAERIILDVSNTGTQQP